MFSGRGYCTQPTCFPVLGAPPILVFLCKTHCRHMLCYRHWLSHQTNKTDEQEIDQSPSSVYFTRIERWIYMDFWCLAVTLDSDIDEQESFPDLLKECTNQDHEIIGKI